MARDRCATARRGSGRFDQGALGVAAAGQVLVADRARVEELRPLAQASRMIAMAARRRHPAIHLLRHLHKPLQTQRAPRHQLLPQPLPQHRVQNLLRPRRVRHDPAQRAAGVRLRRALDVDVRLGVLAAGEWGEAGLAEAGGEGVEEDEEEVDEVGGEEDAEGPEDDDEGEHWG
eukprot:CAMPEP_0174885670 /NCGR_PEP_ID=MMETSP0167-20121228/941_1 /TAXON_ID=38298 /ORGANISM="Rhodella maculata, Strain CCMP736" /LENGTH=173 /DNA_ID=CAMNT_0016121333 /DNA_START=198 /DNA_END=715 /DNA_ORIENTATION=+